MRYGILLAGQGKGTILRVDDSWKNAASKIYRCRVYFDNFDTDEQRKGLTTFNEPGNNFSLYSSPGVDIGERSIRPYVEVRGNLGQLGVLSQAYRYNEYGLIAGVKF